MNTQGCTVPILHSKSVFNLVSSIQNFSFPFIYSAKLIILYLHYCHNPPWEARSPRSLLLVHIWPAALVLPHQVDVLLKNWWHLLTASRANYEHYRLLSKPSIIWSLQCFLPNLFPTLCSHSFRLTIARFPTVLQTYLTHQHSNCSDPPSSLVTFPLIFKVFSNSIFWNPFTSFGGGRL